jgi:hypothetical protein
LVGRAQKLIGDRDCVERGYLLIPQAIGCFTEDPAAALDLFEAANRVGDQFADAGLCVLSQMGQGQALIALGRCAEALTLLDEAIVAVSHSDLPPLVVGNVLCGAIERGVRAHSRTSGRTPRVDLSHFKPDGATPSPTSSPIRE